MADTQALCTNIWQSTSEYPTTPISGLPTIASQTFAISQLIATPYSKAPSVILWCFQTPSERDQAALLLAFWQKYLPHNYAVHTTKESSLSWLVPMLNMRPSLILTTAFELQQELPFINSPETIPTLTPGDTTSTLQIRKLCLANNYFETSAVQEEGSFAIRGSIIELRPFGFTNTVRITFDDATVEKISLLHDTDETPETLTHFTLPGLSKETAPLYTWMSHAELLILHETQSLQPFIKKALPKRAIVLQTFSDDQAAFDYKVTALPKNTSLAACIHKIHEDHIDTLYTSEPAPDTMPSIPTTAFPYIEPWYSKTLRTLCVVNARDEKRRTSTKRTKLLLSALTPGDYIVHQDHGVGRFTELTTQSIDGIDQDYIVLTYAKGDKLYIPPYQIHKITKYIGEAHPKVNRLSGSNWPAMVKKIREETIHLAHEIIAQSAKRQLTHSRPFHPHPDEQALADDFQYDLTADQTTAFEDICDDLASGLPMDRLLCGDVAFGKTEIALRSAFRCVRNNTQVALLAPTTILVQQHFDTFSKRLAGHDVRIGLLSRWQTAREQKEIVEKVRQGKIDIIIGTHRLLSQDVVFSNLGMLIIDEEQKFGVQDKDKIRKRRPHIHTLSMSATPIPRTLNYSLSGIRDISLIQTPPPGRLPVTTRITPHSDTTIVDALTQEMHRGGQTYYLIRKVKEIPAKVAYLEKLVPQARIGIAHGSLPPKELAHVMEAFDAGELDVLVASTIIENGLDVANANTLIVDNAAHFGLSQLYQLRGRIGRSEKQGFAYFLFQRQKLTGIAAKRLQALQSAYELGAGFDIAVRDLEIRGAGNLLGKEQHGQIAAVGLALYTELLEEAVAHEKDTTESMPRIDTTIDIPIPATLEHEPDLPLGERLRIYQELAFAQNISELEKTAASVLPQPRTLYAENIVTITTLKLLCQQHGIYALDAVVKSRTPFDAIIKLSFVPDAKKEIIRHILSTNDNWQYDGAQLKIKTSHLGDDWLQKLVSVLKKNH